MIWVPNNPEALGLTDAPGIGDEAVAALAYLRATSGNFFDQDRARAYIDLAPRALALAAKAAGLNFTLNTSSRDYYPDAAGATLGRRALNPVPTVMRGMNRDLFARLRWPLGTMMALGAFPSPVATPPITWRLAAALRPCCGWQAMCCATRATVCLAGRAGRGWPTATSLSPAWHRPFSARAG